MSRPDDDLGFVAAASPAFIGQGQEQIASIEQLLAELADAPDDRELLDALFRCAHTVKGSAGSFGLDAVVPFTRHVEALLDRLREGVIALTPELTSLLLQCNDQIRQLIDECTGATGDPQGEPQRAALVAQLQACTAAMPEATPQRWTVAARLGADAFRNGMDPLAIRA